MKAIKQQFFSISHEKYKCILNSIKKYSMSNTLTKYNFKKHHIVQGYLKKMTLGDKGDS